MKKKLLPLLLISLISSIVGFTNVHAATLVQEKIPDVWYTRRGGGQDYMSAQYHTYTMDGKTVYCIQPNVPITTSDYSGATGWVNSPYSQEVNQKIQLIGYYGYDYPGHQTLRYRMATQALVWETVGGQIVEYWTEASGWGDYINVDAERNEIMRLVNAHYNKPSFSGSSKTGIIGQELSFLDTSSILSEYEVYKSGNALARINGNYLYITPKGVGEITTILKRKTYSDDPSQIFVGIDEKSQRMGYFRIDDPVTSSVRVTSYGGKVSAEKIDSQTLTTTPRGDAKLSGAVYGVYDENDIRVGELTINNDSVGTSDYLTKLGKFYLKEEKSSLGYTLDNTKYYFEITEDNLNPKIKVYEQVIEKDIEIYKVKAKGETGELDFEPNVTFEFYLKSTMELYGSETTDSKGHLRLTLPYGTYVVKQKTSTPNYEKVDDFEIVINEKSDDLITKILSNAEITAKLKVVKIDMDSKNVIARSGIKFKIKNLDSGEYICQNITYPTQSKVCVFETDSNGVFITPYNLGSGNYQIEELDQVINGYLWNSEPLKFTISEDSKFYYDDDFGVMLEVKFSNKQVMGKLNLTKLGEKLVIEDNGFHYEEIKLSGVVYNLYADEDIYSADGTLIYNNKDLVTSFEVKDGTKTINDLYLGKYCLIEQETNKDHVLDSTPYCFFIDYKDQYSGIIDIEATLRNYLIKSDFSLTKTDISTGEVIEGALIEIYTEDDKLIYSGKTDKDGLITIKDLSIGKYYFMEKEAPIGYVLNPEKMYFEISENGKTVKSELKNEIIKGTFDFTKTDFSTGEPLPNTLIEIYNLDDELLYSVRTDENGKIIIEDMPYGKYYFIEKEAPEGYQLNSEKMYFEIKEDGEIVKANMVNELVKVPNTNSNRSYYLYAFVGLLTISGIGMIIYDKKRKK